MSNERIRLCDVIDKCEDCPRYADDCDGDKRIEPTDLISRADAIEALRGLFDMRKSRAKVIVECFGELLNALPSADAEQVTGKLQNPCDSLLTDDSAECKEQKSKLDLISRKVLMDRLESFCKWCKDGRLQGAEFVWDCIVPNVPSADAVQGEWIYVDNYYRLATCSHCHRVTMFEKWGEDIKPYNFCPNCGARMKGGDTE